MRWMLLLAFVVTVPAFVWLVARWPARTDAPPNDPRERAGTPRARPVAPRPESADRRPDARRPRAAGASAMEVGTGA